MSIEIRAYLGSRSLDKRRLEQELNESLRAYHPSSEDVIKIRQQLMMPDEVAKVEARIIYEKELEEFYERCFQSWKGSQEDFCRIWYNFNTETLSNGELVVHLVLDLSATVLTPEFIATLDQVLKSHCMLEPGQKLKLKDQIGENLKRITIIERKTDHYSREQQSILLSPHGQKKKCHIFSKPWADATWERSDRHLSPLEAQAMTHYSIQVFADPTTGSERVVSIHVDVNKTKPNK